MTPTLSGRWQTRLLLLGTVGLVVTFFFAAFFQALTFESVFHIPFVLLFYVAVLGLGWDVLYNVIQGYRWDSDWPPVYQLFAGIAEGVLLFVLVRVGFVLGTPPELPFWMFVTHYGAVWFFTFLMTQGPLRILFPQWRFRGGQFGRHPATRE